MITIIGQYLVCIKVLHNLVDHSQGPTYIELLQLLANVESTQLRLVLDDLRQVCIIGNSYWQRKAISKNAQTTTQLHSSHMLVK